MIRKNFKWKLLIFSIIFSGLLSIFPGKDCNWDLKNYHIYNPYSFLNNRLNYDIAPAQLQTYFDPSLDLPFYILMFLLNPIIYGFAVGAIQGLNFYLIFFISYELFPDERDKIRKIISFLIAIAGFLSVNNLAEIGTSYHDNIVSIFVLWGLYLLVKSKDKSQKTILLSSFLLGVGSGFKLTTFIYGLPFLILLPIFGNSTKEKFKKLLIGGFSFLSGFLLIHGYWMLKLWTNFKNPFFPYFNKFFKSPYYDNVSIARSNFFPRNLMETFFYPFYFAKKQRLVNELLFRDLRLALCYTLLIVFIVFMIISRKKLKGKLNKNYVFLLLFFPFSYILWQEVFSVYRYLTALLLLSPIFIALILKILIKNKKIFTLLLTLILLIVTITIYPMDFGRCNWGKKYLEAKVPGIKNDSKTIILTTWEPTSYVIPFFPKKVRFICVKNNFLSPNSKSLLEKKVKEILKKPGNRYYLITAKENLNIRGDVLTLFYEGILNAYNLKFSKEKPLKIKTTFETLYLYKVVRINEKG